MTPPDYTEQAKALAGSHYECEDCWYSCPLSSEGCCDDSVPKDTCTCSYNDRVTAIAAALSQAAQPVWMPVGEKPTYEGWWWWREPLSQGRYLIRVRQIITVGGKLMYASGQELNEEHCQFAPCPTPKEAR